MEDRNTYMWLAIITFVALSATIALAFMAQSEYEEQNVTIENPFK